MPRFATSASCAAAGLFAAVVLLSPTSAGAQPSAPVVTSGGTASSAGFGVGAAAFLSDPGGVLNVVYDLPRFHIEGLLGFSSVDTGGGANRTVTSFHFGARGWYHLHVGSNSDFSLGGGVGVRTASGGGGPSTTATLIEPGMQARVFLTPNFTLNLTGGLSLVFGDNVQGTSTATGFSLGAQLIGGVGFTYFFR